MRRVLDQATGGERAAETRLFALLSEDLRERAHERRGAMGKNVSLLTTDLVHDCWLRLYGGAEPQWENRRHFFGAAANAMRNILVDRARRRSALKRDERRKQELEDDDLPEFACGEPVIDVLSLHLSLEELEQQHPRPAQVVTLRFFAGLTMPEIAEVLGISLASAERDWRFGRAWLQHALEDGGK
jgi:RNA polymerase sigma factor (TIGR02999 family)